MISKDYLREQFAKLVKLFYKEHFQQSNKEYPPKLPNGEAIDLFDLYMFVEELGGNKKVSSEAKWPEVAKMLGFRETYGLNLNIIYHGYLELMASKYDMKKTKQGMFGESSKTVIIEENVAASKVIVQDKKMVTTNEVGSSSKVVHDDVQIDAKEVKARESKDIDDGELLKDDMSDESFEDEFDLNVLNNVSDLDDFTIIVHNKEDPKPTGDQEGKVE
ncbi:putative transcription factor & chromatin remodeling ARID family [Helianthus anomalus]